MLIQIYYVHFFPRGVFQFFHYGKDVLRASTYSNVNVGKGIPPVGLVERAGDVGFLDFAFSPVFSEGFVYNIQQATSFLLKAFPLLFQRTVADTGIKWGHRDGFHLCYLAGAHAGAPLRTIQG